LSKVKPPRKRERPRERPERTVGIIR
jgi:hypothetical protein